MKRVGFQWLSRGATRHPEIMTMKGGSLCAVNFPSKVGIIRHPDRGYFVFDTGYDPAFKEATQPFPERFYRWMTPLKMSEGLKWQNWLADHELAGIEIAGVIISHFHGDHVAGLRALEGLPIFCSKSGLQSVRTPNRFKQVRKGLLAELVPEGVDRSARFFEETENCDLPNEYYPFEAGKDLLGDGSLVAVPLPGHCVGHWGLAMHTEQDQYVLLSADAAWSGKAIQNFIPPPRVTTALLGDTRPYRETLFKLHQACTRNTELVILPSHCEESTQRLSKPSGHAI